MKLDREELAKCSEILSKEQLRIVGHMSKRTATYLLESKLLPATYTGRKTRCYKIKKKDVIEFFDSLEKNPTKFATPERWYSTKVKLKAKPYVIRYVPNTNIDTEKLREFYEKKLEPYVDVLNVAEVAAFTGYDHKTVTSWIRTGRLEALLLLDRYIVPKELLLNWLTSERYNNIERKSKEHVRCLWKVIE